MKNLLSILALAGCLQAAALSSGHTRYLPIAIPAVGSPVDSMPVLIYVDSTVANAATLWTTADSSGRDIAFADTNGDSIPAYRVYFSRGNKKAYWRIGTTIPAGGKTVRMYFGRSGYTTTARQTGALRAAIHGWWEGVDVTDSLYDLTRYSNTFDATNASLQAGSNGTYAFKGDSMGGGSGFIAPDATSLTVGDMFIKAWVYATGTCCATTLNIVLQKNTTNNKEFYLGYYGGGAYNGEIDFETHDETAGGRRGVYKVGTNINNSTWRYLSASANSAGDTIKLNMDNQDLSPTADIYQSYTQKRNTDSPLYISYYDVTHSSDGGRQSVALFAEIPSTAEQNALYNNEAAPLTWLEFGTPISIVIVDSISPVKGKRNSTLIYYSSSLIDSSSYVRANINSLSCSITRWSTGQVRATIPGSSPRGYYWPILKYVSGTDTIILDTASNRYRVLVPEIVKDGSN